MPIAALAIGVVLEFVLEVCTSLDRYGATLAQAIDAAGHSAVTSYGIKDSALWAAFALVVLVIRGIYRYRLICDDRSAR